jgi:hypothetical protein
MISDLGGYASGNLEVKGTLDNPRTTGLARIDSGEVTIDYLNTRYKFSGEANFRNRVIKLERVDLVDRFGNKGVLKGTVAHQNFKNFELNIDIDHTNYEFLNTTINENSLYYGNAYSTGKVSITGPVENVLISADITTAPNTRIYIPLTEFDNFGEEDYITFLNPSDTLQRIDSLVASTTIKGLNIDFDINITPEAYVELIFDPRTGDIIRGRGRGNLQMTIDADGNFQLFGGLEVSEGAYNFTTSIINKEFQITPGGTLTWYGDPYNGNMNIEATYRQLADPNDWLNVQDGQTSQKAPALVVLEMEGPMTSPNIDFRIELDETNTAVVSDQWRSLLSRVNNDQQELKRQVFSLLILRKFSPQNSFVVGGVQQGIGGSVSEFFSNQLSYWLNQVDENLEVSIDLNSLDSDAFNTFQLRLAYTFLDGRLRVTRGGGVTTVVDEDQQLANIIGDWSVEYLLTEDGRWRAKLFSRANQSVVNQGLTQTQETGASLQYIRSFDELKELLGKTRASSTSTPVSSPGAPQ